MDGEGAALVGNSALSFNCHITRKKRNCVWWQLLTRLTVVTITLHT